METQPEEGSEMWRQKEMEEEEGEGGDEQSKTQCGRAPVGEYF